MEVAGGIIALWVIATISVIVTGIITAFHVWKIVYGKPEEDGSEEKDTGCNRRESAHIFSEIDANEADRVIKARKIFVLIIILLSVVFGLGSLIPLYAPITSLEFEVVRSSYEALILLFFLKYDPFISILISRLMISYLGGMKPYSEVILSKRNWGA
jgi:NADH:ubiquinone oxidoreductase subunit 5 (subunit L)/multisubunit Na+/H+ antiporter MnhA subunit